MKKVVVFLLVAIPVLTGNAFADILIVSNKNVPETTLSRDYIRGIFLGKRVQWKDNSKIRFVTVREEDVHEAFLKQYLNKSPGKWKVYWKRMIFTGKGIPPESLTEAELIAWGGWKQRRRRVCFISEYLTRRRIDCKNSQNKIAGRHMKKTGILIVVLFIGPALNTFALDIDQVQIHGFVSQGYLVSDENDFWLTETDGGTFEFNEIGLAIITEATDSLRLGVQFLSRDMGDGGNNEVSVDWAYGDYRFRNWLGLKAGLLKRPHGLYNQSRDVDAARTGIFLPMSVYPEVTREFYLATRGVGIHGLLPGGLSYEIQYGALPLDADDSNVKQFDIVFGSKTENVDSDDVFGFMLRWDTPLPGLALSFTGTGLGDITYKSNVGELNFTKREMWVASLEYEFENLLFSAEYMQNDGVADLNGRPFMDSVWECYHATGAYRFAGWFELGLGYSAHYLDKDDKDGESFKARGRPAAMAWRKNLTLSTRFDINDYMIFKLEGHCINGLAGIMNDPGPDPSEDWFLFAAKMTFSF